jgi:hypothetical protein
MCQLLSNKRITSTRKSARRCWDPPGARVMRTTFGS